MKTKQATTKEAEPIQLFDDSRLLIGARFRGASGKRSILSNSAVASKGAAAEIFKSVAHLARKKTKNSVTLPDVVKFKAVKENKKVLLAEAK